MLTHGSAKSSYDIIKFSMGGVLKQERQEDKRKRFLTFLKQIKTWQLFLSLLPLLFLSATFLRFDHLKMMDLKTKV